MLGGIVRGIEDKTFRTVGVGEVPGPDVSVGADGPGMSSWELGRVSVATGRMNNSGGECFRRKEGCFRETAMNAR